jgi:thymidylate synthase
MIPTFIEATTIPDAWFQCLYRLIEEYTEEPEGLGSVHRYTVATGSNPGTDRIEFDYITVHIKHPGVRPLLPQMPEHLDIPAPADDKYLAEYMVYLLTDGKGQNEHYTYGERLASQYERVVNYYRDHGGNTNRMCMEIGTPGDLTSYDDLDGSTPCLRLIDTRIQGNRLHWVVYFRSWNLWGGFPVNLAGLQQAKEIMAEEIGVEDGEIIAISKGLNLREYNIPMAYRRLQREGKR